MTLKGLLTLLKGNTRIMVEQKFEEGDAREPEIKTAQHFASGWEEPKSMKGLSVSPYKRFIRAFPQYGVCEVLEVTVVSNNVTDIDEEDFILVLIAEPA